MSIMCIFTTTHCFTPSIRFEDTATTWWGGAPDRRTSFTPSIRFEDTATRRCGQVIRQRSRFTPSIRFEDTATIIKLERVVWLERFHPFDPF